ncbi:hypothetical protein B0H19DRAFT_1284759 [Mycena capillaripes]|nr:hypothetical protein B0H19DRAFT_1284759 [Mycena capillaripes]
MTISVLNLARAPTPRAQRAKVLVPILLCIRAKDERGHTSPEHMCWPGVSPQAPIEPRRTGYASWARPSRCGTSRNPPRKLHMPVGTDKGVKGAHRRTTLSEPRTLLALSQIMTMHAKARPDAHAVVAHPDVRRLPRAAIHRQRSWRSRQRYIKHPIPALPCAHSGQTRSLIQHNEWEDAPHGAHTRNLHGTSFARSATRIQAKKSMRIG